MVQEQEASEVKPFVAADEEEDVHIEGTVQVQRQELELEQYGHGHDHDHGHGHDHEQAEGKGERPAAEQDEEGGSGIEGEQEEVQDDVQGAVQSVGALGCLESVGHVPSVEPEPDAMQRYLEGSGP